MDTPLRVHVSFCAFQNVLRKINTGTRRICDKLREPWWSGGRFLSQTGSVAMERHVDTLQKRLRGYLDKG